jgi:hypothetical protein
MTITRPAGAFHALLSVDRQTRTAIGRTSAIGLGLLYSFTVAALQAGGAEPVVKPTLPIARRRYYFWLTFLTVPTFAAIWLTASQAAHTAARTLGGHGTADDTRAAMGVALSLPVLITMWIPETIMAVLLVTGRSSWQEMRRWGEHGTGLVFHVLRQVLGGLCMLMLTTVALRHVHGLSWPRAALAALAGLAPAGGLTALLIR